MADRDSKGRFVKGHTPSNKGKGGRAKRSVEEKYLKTFSSTVTKKDLKEIILAVIARAKAQDMVAARIILEYALGKPQQQVQVDVVSDLNIVLGWPEDGDLENSPSGAA